jgi:filamentous hemagglutinin family protein
MRCLRTNKNWVIAVSSGIVGAVLGMPGLAQITPDATLPSPSIVNSNRITGGTEVGSNLFHSFREFSIPTGSAAIFENSSTIQNIFARVTGNSISSLDGLLQTNGTANLYLLNPNGVLFGKNASLNIAGSLFVTTAPALKFADGTVFSADVTQPPLLTISTPVGIQWGTRSTGSIRNAGALNVGQNLTIAAADITSSGTLTATGITLQAKQNITTGELVSSSGGVLVESESGNIDAGTITASALNAGDITLKAAGDITTRSISTLGIEPPEAFDLFPDIPDATAGRIWLESLNGSIDTHAGVLTTQASIQSGGIVLQAAKDIWIGSLKTSAIGFFAGYPFSPAETPVLTRGLSINAQGRVLAMGDAAQPVTILVDAVPGRSGGFVGTGAIDIRGRTIEFDRVELTNNSQSDTTFIGDRLSLTRSQLLIGADLSLPTLRFQIADAVLLNQSKITAERNSKRTFRFSPSYATVDINAGSFTAIDSEILLASAYRDRDNLKLNTSGAIVLDNSAITIGISGYSSERFIADDGFIGVSFLFPFEGGKTTLQADSIQLLNRSSITALVPAGQLGSAGFIQLNALKDIVLSNSEIAVLVGENGIGKAGRIELNSDRLILRNTSSLNATSFNEADYGYPTDAAGIAFEPGIAIASRKIEIKDRSQVTTTAFGRQTPLNLVSASKGSNIQIQADEIDIAGRSALRAGSESDMQTGIGGNIEISARNLALQDQAEIASGTSGAANGGAVQVQARSLTLRTGSTISTSTIGTGDAGNIQITASDRLSITGESAQPRDWFTTVLENPVLERTGLFASSTTSGRSGSITVTSPKIAIANQALISVNSSATGEGGKLKINADQELRVRDSALSALTFAGNGAELEINTPILSLDRAALIAATIQGEGGNIVLNVPERFILRNGSQVTARAFTTAPGGNIDVNGKFILATANNITANAVQGNGGNIQINALSIIGIQNRPGLTSGSDINASSEFGIDGTVNLTTLKTEPEQAVQDLPTLVDTSNQIAQTCSPQTRANSFVVTGKGGLSPDPTEALSATSVWNASEIRPNSKASKVETPIVEATHWVRNADGSVILQAGRPVQSAVPTCSGRAEK